MHNFKLKNFLGSIIVLGGLLLSACNGGGGGGSSTSPASNVIENVLNSDNNLNNVKIGNATVSFDVNNNATVELPFGTKFPATLEVDFDTAGKQVTLGGNDFTTGSSYEFESDTAVDFVVTAANGDKKTYIVTVKEALPFAPYYPKGCTLNSSVDGESCACLQDTTKGYVWTRKPSSNYQCYNSLMSESGTCNNDTNRSESGYIPNLNKKEMCGFKSGWNLPSESQLNTMSAYVSGVQDGKKGDWFNEHGFSEIKNKDAIYLGQCSANRPCTDPLGADGGAWGFYTINGVVGLRFQRDSDGPASGWGVHSQQ